MAAKKAKFKPKLLIPTALVLAIGVNYIYKAKSCLSLAQQNVTLLEASLSDAATLNAILSNRKLSAEESSELETFNAEHLKLQSFSLQKLPRSEMKKLNLYVQSFYEKGDRLLGLSLFKRPMIENKDEMSEANFLRTWRNDKDNYFSKRYDLGSCGVK